MNPFASIWEEENKPQPKIVAKLTKPKANHSEARAIYDAYLVKAAVLAKHQAYAQEVVKATAGLGMTFVKPLATMGCGGDALLCDHCFKPMILETAPYYGIYADFAWALNPKRDEKWKSYIKGGMVVYIAENGTLRIYHGYQGVAKHCCTLAKAELDAAESKYIRETGKLTLLARFFRDEFGGDDISLNKLLSDIALVMFSFDPGIGINHP